MIWVQKDLPSGTHRWTKNRTLVAPLLNADPLDFSLATALENPELAGEVHVNGIAREAHMCVQMELIMGHAPPRA